MTKTTAIIDGDIVAYRCAAANESCSIKATHKETGTVKTHAHRTALKEHIRDIFEIDEFDVEDVQTAEDVSYALNGVKTTIESLCKSCWADSYEIYLSGDNNFRLDLPLPTRYKSNREDTLRPLQLKACREYLVKHHGAIIVHGKEADDMLSQRAYEGNKAKVKNIIASIDKDAYGVDSWLYNWTKMSEPFRIKGLGEIQMEDKKVKGYGRKWFYTQWVLGDPVDCFKPSEIAGKKFGDASAFKLLSSCNTDKECIEAVYEQYKYWYPKPVTYTAWDGTEHAKDVIQIMEMYAACAHMQRFDGDFIDVKALLTKLGITYD